MARSLQKYSAVLRTFCILFFTISIFVRLQTGAAPQNYKKGILDTSFPGHLIPGPLDGDSGPKGDFPFDSMDDQPFPDNLDASFILEGEAQATQMWPRVMLDYMRQQLRYRGRTKKSTKRKKTQLSIGL